MLDDQLGFTGEALDCTFIEFSQMKKMAKLSQGGTTGFG